MLIKVVIWDAEESTEVNFRVKRTSPMGKLMKVYSEKVFLSSSFSELMHAALFKRSPSLLQRLLYKESDIDREEGGETALDMAVRRNNHTAALLLVYRGATALVADVSKYRELVELVLLRKPIAFLSLLSRLPGPSLTRSELMELAELFGEEELWSHLTSHPHLLA